MPRARSLPTVTAVGPEGIRLTDAEDCVLDVSFEGRRIWSFWLHRDTEVIGGGERRVAWPQVLHRFLHGLAEVRIQPHGAQEALYEDEVRFDDQEGRVELVNPRGMPLGVDNTGALMPTFENRTADQTKPLLDSMITVLDQLTAAGISAFPAYGTLLGAVRQGTLIGHDSDADLGYVSRFRDPYDVCRESFDVQRRLIADGFTVMRYSGASFKVSVRESDGFERGLDVFGGYLDRLGRLNLMGEVRTPYQEDWLFPLGSATLEGREVPVPAQPEHLLVAMYGPSWRVPDPAFSFTTPKSTISAFNHRFRQTRARRKQWSAAFRGQPLALNAVEPSDLARRVLADGLPARVLDVGAGLGGDALWLGRQGATVTAYDYVVMTAHRAMRRAAAEDLDVHAVRLNLQEWRSVLAEGARLAQAPEERVILANHIYDAVPRFGRDSLHRFASMALRGGGRLYASFWTAAPPADEPSSAIALEEVVSGLERRGARILDAADDAVDGAASQRREGRVVAQWDR